MGSNRNARRLSGRTTTNREQSGEDATVGYEGPLAPITKSTASTAIDRLDYFPLQTFAGRWYVQDMQDDSGAWHKVVFERVRCKTSHPDLNGYEGYIWYRWMILNEVV